MQCKYCGKEVLGNICPECAKERHLIMQCDKNCVKANKLYELWRFFQKICLMITAVLGSQIVFFDKKTISHYMVVICSSILIFFFGKLRGLYYSESEFWVENEMKKRH